VTGRSDLRRPDPTLLAVAGVALALAAALFLVRSALPPATLRWASSAFVLVSALYVWRKRGGQELLPGSLRAWLHVHGWSGLLALEAALLPEGPRFDGALEAAAFAALAATVATGLLGAWLYARVPPQVAAGEARHLAVGWTVRRIRALEGMLDPAGARPPPPEAVADRLRAQLARLKERLRHQRRLRFALQALLWLHVPASLALLALLALLLLLAA
jgi:hypothetical protein